MGYTKQPWRGGWPYRIICGFIGHDPQSGRLYSDGYENTCQRCGATQQVVR